jgi:outer membrane protein assembly factor BamE (lipoprotein component of BamABCDE complex)
MIKTFVMVLGCLLLAGCPIVVPLPDPRHGAGVIPPEVQKELSPGTTTRTEVLLLLGNPLDRFEDDRFFVYSWKEAHAVTGLLTPIGVLGLPDLGDEHRLALEFRRDGVLRRVQTFGSAFEFDSEDRAALESWMKAQGSPE